MKSWKLSWKEEVCDEKKCHSLKIKVFEVLLCFLKIKLLIKVQVYVKKLLDICSLQNVKYHESYNILREEVYEEKFLIRQDVSSLRQSYQLSNLSYIDFKQSILHLVTL